MKHQFMRRAIELSRIHMNSGDGGPFGAVIVKDGKIIGEGWNRVTSTMDPTAHAEIEAIRAASQKISNFNLSGAEIYTSCEPCPMCLSAIYWARLSAVYFGNTRNDAAKIQFDDDHIYREICKDIKARQIPTNPLLRDEAHVVFTEWSLKTNKVTY